jgi:hypothetical protein
MSVKRWGLGKGLSFSKKKYSCQAERRTRSIGCLFHLAFISLLLALSLSKGVGSTYLKIISKLAPLVLQACFNRRRGIFREEKEMARLIKNIPRAIKARDDGLHPSYAG